MHNSYLTAIKSFEGFTPRAQWDYAQETNGFGTRAQFPGEVIDRAEAERRFQSEIAQAQGVVERFAPQLDDGTKAALTSLTFNAGPRWTESGLGAAIKNGDLGAARDIFLQYNKAGGETLEGLISRRASEAQWFGTGAAPAARAVAAVMQIDSQGASAGSVDALRNMLARRFEVAAIAVPRASSEAQSAAAPTLAQPVPHIIDALLDSLAPPKSSERNRKAETEINGAPKTGVFT